MKRWEQIWMSLKDSCHSGKQAFGRKDKTMDFITNRETPYDGQIVSVNNEADNLRLKAYEQAIRKQIRDEQNKEEQQ